MKEDIEVLREIQQGFSSYNDFMVMEAGERQIQAIENLITRHKEQEDKIKKALKYCNSKSTFQTFGDENCKRILDTYISKTKFEIKRILEEGNV